MSRSRRRSPVTGRTTAVSEREDKQRWHRAYRRAERQRLVAAPDSLPLDPQAYGNLWVMRKDGKHYWGRAIPLRYVRK